MPQSYSRFSDRSQVSQKCPHNIENHINILTLHNLTHIASLEKGTAATSSRSLYSATSLGIDNYLGTREKIQNYMIDNGDKFRGKMTEFLEDGTKNMIFTEDLKNMVHIVQKDHQQDIELTINMIKK